MAARRGRFWVLTVLALVAASLHVDDVAYAADPVVVDLPVATFTNPVQVTYADPITLGRALEGRRSI